MDDELIDYFAGCALTGLLMVSDEFDSDYEIGIRAYDIAQTMIQVKKIITEGKDK